MSLIINLIIILALGPTLVVVGFKLLRWVARRIVKTCDAITRVIFKEGW